MSWVRIRLYMTDCIVPYGHVKHVIRDMRSNFFPNAHAKALRFVERGKTRPMLWNSYGVSYQRLRN